MFKRWPARTAWFSNGFQHAVLWARFLWICTVALVSRFQCFCAHGDYAWLIMCTIPNIFRRCFNLRICVDSKCCFKLRFGQRFWNASKKCERQILTCILLCKFNLICQTDIIAIRRRFGEVANHATDLLRQEKLKAVHAHETTLCVPFGAPRFGTTGPALAKIETWMRATSQGWKLEVRNQIRGSQNLGQCAAEARNFS